MGPEIRATLILYILITASVFDGGFVDIYNMLRISPNELKLFLFQWKISSSELKISSESIDFNIYPNKL